MDGANFGGAAGGIVAGGSGGGGGGSGDGRDRDTGSEAGASAAGSTIPTTTTTTTSSVGSQENAVENVDGLLSDYMEKLGTRLSVLETELRYAWKALDLLSQEYVVMWTRMEKAEALLTQQQAIITKMMAEQVDGEKEDEEVEENQPAREEPKDNRGNRRDGDNDGGGGGGGPAGLGGRPPPSYSKDGGGGGGRMGGSSARNSRVPDEAFYRSLNVAHRDSGTVSVGEQELSLIWEEDADVVEKVGSTSPPVGGDAKGKEQNVAKVINEAAEKETTEDYLKEKKESESQSEIEKSLIDENKIAYEASLEVQKLVKQLDDVLEEDSQVIFSAKDYKDYRGCHGSPCVSDIDLEQLTTISSLEEGRNGSLHRTHSTSNVLDAINASSSPSKSQIRPSSNILLKDANAIMKPESPQRKSKPSRSQRNKSRSSLEESLRLLYLDSDSADSEIKPTSSTPLQQHTQETNELLYQCSRLSSSSPLPMDLSSNHSNSSSMISSARAISPSSRLTSSSYNDYLVNQELREALRSATSGGSGRTSPYRPSSRLSMESGGGGREVAEAEALLANYEALAARMSPSLSSSNYARPSAAQLLQQHQQQQSPLPEANIQVQASSPTLFSVVSDRVGSNSSIASASLRTRQDGYLSGRPVSPIPRPYSPYDNTNATLPSSGHSPTKSPKLPSPKLTSPKYTSPKSASPRRSPRSSFLFESAAPSGSAVDIINSNRYRDSHDIHFGLQMPTISHSQASHSPRLSPLPDYSPMNDLSLSMSTAMRKGSSGLDTTLGSSMHSDNVNIRVSPRSPKPLPSAVAQLSSLMQSDSGVSELSWSNLEKSPTSPSRFAAQHQAIQAAAAAQHQHLHLHQTQAAAALSQSAQLSPHRLAYGISSSSQSGLRGQEDADGDGTLPDVTMGSVSQAMGNLTLSHYEEQQFVEEQQAKLQQHLLEQHSKLAGGYDIRERETRDFPPDLTTSSNFLRSSPQGSSMTLTAVSPNLSSKYDVKNDMEILRQDLAAMALARERDLITGPGSQPPTASATIGLDSLYKNNSYAQSHEASRAQSASAYLGRHLGEVGARSASAAAAAAAATETQLSNYYLDAGSKMSRGSFPGSDSDDSSTYSHRREHSSHSHSRKSHAYSRAPSARYHYSPAATFELEEQREREREMLDREISSRSYYHQRAMLGQPSISGSGYYPSKTACYENPSYLVTEPGELKWTQQQTQPHVQQSHHPNYTHIPTVSRRTPSPIEEVHRKHENITGSLKSMQTILVSAGASAVSPPGNGNYESSFPARESYLPHHSHPHPIQSHQPYSHEMAPTGVHYGTLNEPSSVAPYDLREQHYYAQGLPSGYIQSRAGYVSISANASAVQSSSLSEKSEGSERASGIGTGRKNKPKRSASLKSAMNSVGNWLQQDLHLSLPRKERSHSLPSEDQPQKPDIQKQQPRLPPSSKQMSSSSTTASGTSTTTRKKKRHSMSIVSNISGLLHKARKWSSQSEDSEASDTDLYRGKYYRPKSAVDVYGTTGRGGGRYLKPGRGPGGRSYEASESDQSETSLFPRVKSSSIRRTMSEGSGTETESELDRLPDLAQGLFPTIGEAKRAPSIDQTQTPAAASASSPPGGVPAEHEMISPLGSPNGDHLQANKFGMVPAPGEFAASRAVGKYRQKIAANGSGSGSSNGANGNRHFPTVSRANSLPPPRPPPPQYMRSDSELETENESGLIVDNNRKDYNYPNATDINGVQQNRELGVGAPEFLVMDIAGPQPESQVPTIAMKTSPEEPYKEETTRYPEKTIEMEYSPREDIYSRESVQDTESLEGGESHSHAFATVGQVSSTSTSSGEKIPSSSSSMITIVPTSAPGPGEPPPIVMTTEYPTSMKAPPVVMMMPDDTEESDGKSISDSAKSFGVSPTGPTGHALGTSPPRQVLSPGGQTYSTSPQSSFSTTFRTVSQTQQNSQKLYSSQKSFGDTDMGSSTDSATRHSNKIRLDLPSQRTLSEEEDTRSTHSYRSSRVSSRRQSTEESIDSEDEWYKYELRKLEELERQQIAAIESQPTGSAISTSMANSLRFHTYSHATAAGAGEEFPYYQSQFQSIPTAPTVDMKERMNLVLQELLLKATTDSLPPEEQIVQGQIAGVVPDQKGGLSRSSSGGVKQQGDISQVSPRERRLSITKMPRLINRDDSLQDEPLGYVSRRRTNSHEDYDPDSEHDSCASIWKQSEQQMRDRDRDSGRGSGDFGSMIEPPPADIGIRIGIETKKQQQQYHQDSVSLRSTESAFHSAASSSRTVEERPSVSLPSSSSPGDNVWKDEGDDMKDKDGEGSSGETSGPDTPQESFDIEDDESRHGSKENIAVPSAHSVEPHLENVVEEEGKEDTVMQQQKPEERREGEEGETYFENQVEEEPGDMPQLSGPGTGPGTGTGTPTQASRRESTQSSMSISRKLLDMLSMSELKKFGSDENKTGSIEAGLSGIIGELNSSSRGSVSNENDNKMSKISATSMSVDDEQAMTDEMKLGPGGLGSKWGFLKTLKERKAEEKENAAAAAQADLSGSGGSDGSGRGSGRAGDNSFYSTIDFDSMSEILPKKKSSLVSGLACW